MVSKRDWGLSSQKGMLLRGSTSAIAPMLVMVSRKVINWGSGFSCNNLRICTRQNSCINSSLSEHRECFLPLGNLISLFLTDGLAMWEVYFFFWLMCFSIYLHTWVTDDSVLFGLNMCSSVLWFVLWQDNVPIYRGQQLKTCFAFPILPAQWHWWRACIKLH